MPSTTPERRARWPGGDHEALTFLDSRRFTLIGNKRVYVTVPSELTKKRNFFWLMPPGRRGQICTPKEVDALVYLIEEWDFGGVLDCTEATESPEPTT